MAKALRSFCLALWGSLLLVSFSSGRLNLLVRSPFHPLILLAGILLILLAALDGWGRSQQALVSAREIWSWIMSGLVAMAMLLIPPQPSFSNLAANRGGQVVAQEELGFVLPTAQRSLTDWVRLLALEPDPILYDGQPVRISGFVLAMPDGPPRLARLLVRCCLADATPIGLPVRWPRSSPPPLADQWLSIEGTMGLAQVGGQPQSVVIPTRIRTIARPDRPFEP